MFFSRSKPLVGLDIGTSSIKAAVLKSRGKGKGYTLRHLAVEPLPPEVIVEGAIMDSGPIIEAINKIWDSSRIRQSDVAVSLSGHSVIVKRVSIPSMSPEELAESIHWEAEQYIPFDIDDVRIDYQVLGETEGEQMDVLLVAVKKDKINDYTGVISQAGQNPVLVDVDVFALQNAFEMNYGMATEETLALVNIGAAVTNVAVLSSGNSRFWRDLSVGGNQFTEALQRELGVSFEVAERVKKGESEDGIPPDSVTSILESVTGDLLTEVQKTVDFFLSSNRDEQLDKILLSGGGACLPSFPVAMNQRFGCPVDRLDPFRAVNTDSRAFPPETLAEISPAAAVAVGLAIRKVGDR
ncbi:MAG: type IV pilus assembly protein PilM [Acidobacteriota bacterium]